jgi:hypothetical protein
MQKSLISLITVVMFLGVVSAAQSQEVGRKGPCKADIEKFCKDVKPGQGRIVKCLQAHENELSPACKNEIAAEKEKTKEFINSCKPDAEKFCKDVRPGGGRIIHCLKQHQSELSPNCQAYFKK